MEFAGGGGGDLAERRGDARGCEARFLGLGEAGVKERRKDAANGGIFPADEHISPDRAFWAYRNEVCRAKCVWSFWEWA